MIQENKIGQLTELQIVDGGGWLTLASPTNFHRFHKRKILVNTEKTSDYREVSDSEKARLEKSDAAWVEPPQVFVDLWNEACVVRGNNKTATFGGYNPETGYFELNGLTDITYRQAVVIFRKSISQDTLSGCRTNLPVYTPATVHSLLMNTGSVEVFNGAYGVGYGTDSYERKTWDYVQNCSLRSIRNIFIQSFIGYQFQNFSRLEEIRDIYISAKGEMWVNQCPRLSLDSVRTLVEANPSGNAIKVHPAIFAKLTDESNADYAGWHPLVEQAAAKNITFTTP